MTNPAASALLARTSGFFKSHGIAAYVVGGFLRDLLLKMPTADIDLAITADVCQTGAELAKTLNGRFVLLDEKRGTGRIVFPKTEHYTLDLTTIADSITQDLGRRDFTINAMAVPLTSLNFQPEQPLFNITEIIDPFGGLKDIDASLIRTVNDEIFKEDPLRLLRAVRLAAELGFKINPDTETLVKTSGHLLNSVAGERQRDELAKLLDIPDSEPLWPYIDKLGLITALVPEMAPSKGVEQPREHHWDVFDHSVMTIASADFLMRKGTWQYAGKEALTLFPWTDELEAYFRQQVGNYSRRVLLRLAALLHDIAKPDTKIIDETGRTRFLGHPGVGAGMAAAVLKRLRLSSREAKLVEAMVRYHLRPPQMSHTEELPTQHAIYRYLRDAGEASVDTLILSLADHLAARGPDLDITNWCYHCNLVKYVLEQRRHQAERTAPNRLISGQDLIFTFNLKPGPIIGKILGALDEAQASADVTTRDEALALVRQLLAAETEKK